ncbi:MAG TPA: hypothetical protein VER58_15795 [Thermoanaerobaculia bacterium]|nr:hypothetical protein [Thermoanaerobaculia bacterium]
MSDDILAVLTYEGARELLGHIYRVDLGARSIELTVTRVIRAADNRPRPKELHRDAFSIFFGGPADVLLQQRMYDLVGDRESLPHLFIVPIGRSAEGYEYEAVFT